MVVSEEEESEPEKEVQQKKKVCHNTIIPYFNMIESEQTKGNNPYKGAKEEEKGIPFLEPFEI